MDTESRISDLEVKFSFQEDLLQNLNATVTAQENRIAELERLNKHLKERLEEMSGVLSAKPEQTRPPHY